ncbi:DoxX family protein [Flavobacteriaceae bacterium]|mgnify:FL=1|jgi:uncharacterized membrane protein YphA (DoxX/SURF4 family)|nr:DoxX family protein [Flavobacteriaceae bacterium]|tara:strand:+ start:128 stop:517 length:390 start_codon:yes stop_codon:yes gene_type:complete
MVPEKITFILVLAFFSIVFIQSGVDKVFDYKGNLSFLNDLLRGFFSRPLINFALISVAILELTSGILCLIGIFDAIFNPSYFIGKLGLIIGSLALLVLLFGQRVAKNYEGAKTIAIYFILAMLGIVWAL